MQGCSYQSQFSQMMEVSAIGCHVCPLIVIWPGLVSLSMIFRLRTFIRKRAVDTIVRPDPDPDQRHCYDDLKRNTGSRFVCLYPSDVTFYRRYCCGCCCYNC